MRFYVITGSIATGKSSVADIFEELGIATFDQDQAARDVVKKGQPALAEIVEYYGEDILLPDGELDRKKLGNIIFNDDAKRQKLNDIVHPRVFEQEEIFRAAAESRSKENNDNTKSDYAVVHSPLIIESKATDRFDGVIVVDLDPEIQLERLMARNQLTYQEASARISSQMSTTEKLKYADHVINNNGSLDQLRTQVLELKERLDLVYNGENL